MQLGTPIEKLALRSGLMVLLNRPAFALWRSRLPRVTGFAIAVGVPAILAFGLRVYGFESSSIWLDEGDTIRLARMPWPTVLGFNGVYDHHPPLYYAVVKAAFTFGSEVTMARLLSVISGTVSVALIGVIGYVLTGARGACVAGVAAASAPLLVWYSQEARQYALTSVAVLLAYLALLLFWRRPRLAWAAVYAVALAASLYLDYSAIYALVPHAFLLGLLAWKQRLVAAPILVAAGLAAAAFAPWLPSLLASADAVGQSRPGYLGLTIDSGFRTLGAVVGIRGRGEYFATTEPPFALDTSAAQVIASCLAFAAFLLAAASMRSNPRLLAIAASMLIGCLGTAALLSLISPGFAPRTVSYATFGWALFVSWLLTHQAKDRWRVASRSAGGLSLVVPFLVLVTIYAGGHKDEWRDLARDTERIANATDFAILIYPTIAAETAIDTYAPGIHDHPVTVVNDDPEPAILARVKNGSRALIAATAPQSGPLAEALADSGLDVVLRRPYRYDLWLEVWAHPEDELGAPYDVDFGRNAWAVPAGASKSPDGALTLQDSTPSEESAILTLAGRARTLYFLRFEALLSDPLGAMEAFVICGSVDDTYLEVASGGGRPAGVGDGEWHTVTVGALCPDETSQVRLDLRNIGRGPLHLRAPTLQVLNIP